MIAALLLCAGRAAAQDDDVYAALAEQDLRLAVIAERLLIANAHLCRNQMPVTGMIIQSADQYADEVRPAELRSATAAITGIVPDSPAARAGLRAGDVLLGLAGTDIAEVPPPAEGPFRDGLFDHLASQDAGAPLGIVIAREGEVIETALLPLPGCLSLFEISTEKGLSARSDGRVIQIANRLAALVSDEQLAAIFAHELAHSVLEHRARLSAAGVRKGFFGEFGRNQRYNRQVEIEADRLMVHLLANAGYDPTIAPAFFRSAEGRRVTGGLSFVYPTPTSRAEQIEREIAMYLPLGEGPTWPGHLLALRDRSFRPD